VGKRKIGIRNWEGWVDAFLTEIGLMGQMGLIGRVSIRKSDFEFTISLALSNVGGWAYALRPIFLPGSFFERVAVFQLGSGGRCAAAED
jgi:hypothetical protein